MGALVKLQYHQIYETKKIHTWSKCKVNNKRRNRKHLRELWTNVNISSFYQVNKECKWVSSDMKWIEKFFECTTVCSLLTKLLLNIEYSISSNIASSVWKMLKFTWEASAELSKTWNNFSINPNCCSGSYKKSCQ